MSVYWYFVYVCISDFAFEVFYIFFFNVFLFFFFLPILLNNSFSTKQKWFSFKKLKYFKNKKTSEIQCQPTLYRKLVSSFSIEFFFRFIKLVNLFEVPTLHLGQITSSTYSKRIENSNFSGFSTFLFFFFIKVEFSQLISYFYVFKLLFF